TIERHAGVRIECPGAGQGPTRTNAAIAPGERLVEGQCVRAGDRAAIELELLNRDVGIERNRTVVAVEDRVVSRSAGVAVVGKNMLGVQMAALLQLPVEPDQVEFVCAVAAVTAIKLAAAITIIRDEWPKRT